MKTLDFIKDCISKIDNTSIEEFSELYVALKMQCTREYQHDLIFSIRITGPDFFHRALKYIEGTEFLKAEKNEKLSEYDENFNKWLKIVRAENNYTL